MRPDPGGTEDTRTLVERAVRLRPGAWPALLHRLTDASPGAIDHAVHTLLQEGLIEDRGSASHPAYFPVGCGVGPAFRLHGQSLDVLECVYRSGGGTVSDLAAGTGLALPQVSRTVAMLQEEGCITVLRRGREKFVLPVPAL